MQQHSDLRGKKEVQLRDAFRDRPALSLSLSLSLTRSLGVIGREFVDRTSGFACRRHRSDTRSHFLLAVHLLLSLVRARDASRGSLVHPFVRSLSPLPLHTSSKLSCRVIFLFSACLCWGLGEKLGASLLLSTLT